MILVAGLIVTENSGVVFSASRRSSTIPMTETRWNGSDINGSGELEEIYSQKAPENSVVIPDNFFLKYTMVDSQDSIAINYTMR